MRVGIMQPYFFPYIAYWQLMNCVDTFVIYDDVNFIKKGWINRNRILINGEAAYINLPMRGISQNKLIKEVYVNKDEREQQKTLDRIKFAYINAPFFNDVFPIIEEIFASKEETASGFISDSFRFICLCLGIRTKRIMSSDIEKDNELRGEDKIIAICEEMGAKEYVNPIGGIELYKPEKFNDAGIKLSFLNSKLTPYRQFGSQFIPALSIIDVLMFNGVEATKRMLNDYSIIEAKQSRSSL